MAENHMEWLREHMRNHIAGAASTAPTDAKPTDKVLNFRRSSPGPAKGEAMAAVNLVYQAADMISGLQDRATQIEARAGELVKRAIEKLHIAEARIQEPADAGAGVLRHVLRRLADQECEWCESARGEDEARCTLDPECVVRDERDGRERER